MRVSDTIDKTKSAVRLQIVAGGRLKAAGEQADFGEEARTCLDLRLFVNSLSLAASSFHVALAASRDKITIFL